MRVSTRSLQLQFLATLANQQSRLAQIQEQAASGKSVQTAGDNPAAAVQIVSLENSIQQLVGFETNSGIAQGRLSLEEQALNNVVNNLQRIRDLVISARGPGKTEVERRLIGDEVQELFAGIMDTANTQDGEGRYLFAGNQVQSQPFTQTAGGIVYNGDQGVRSQRISESRTVQESDSGADVFEQIRAGNGSFTVSPGATNTGGVFYGLSSVTDTTAWDQQPYTINFIDPDNYEVRDGGGALVTSSAYQSGDTVSFRGIAITLEGEAATGDTFSVAPSPYQSVFTTVQNILTALDSNVVSSSQQASFQSATNTGLLNIDRALENISEVRSRVGQRLSVIEDQQSSNDRFSIEVQRILSRAQDGDLASILSELEAQAFALEAAQRSYARIQSQSLFDFL